MNAWQRVWRWRFLSRPVIAVRGPPTSEVAFRAPPTPAPAGIGRGLSNATGRNWTSRAGPFGYGGNIVGTGGNSRLDAGRLLLRRSYATTPRYVLAPKSNGVTPRVMQAEGVPNVVDGSAIYNKNQHMFHEYRTQPTVPKHWNASVWFNNGKPVVFKHKSYTQGKNMETLRSIVPSAPIPIPEQIVPANITSNNAIAMSQNPEQKNATNTASVHQTSFSLRNYNSWLRSDVIPTKPIEEIPDLEIIESSTMPAWYKTREMTSPKTTATTFRTTKAAKATTSTTTESPNDLDDFSLRRLGTAESSRPRDAESSRLRDEDFVPSTQWKTDFDAVVRQLQYKGFGASSGIDMPQSNQAYEGLNKLSQIVVDFEKMRWLPLPQRTHFLRPDSSKLESSLRGFASFAATSASSFSSSSSSSIGALRRKTTSTDFRSLDDVMNLITGKKKTRYFVKTKAFKAKSSGAENISRNNETTGDQNNNSGDQVYPVKTLDEVIAMIVDPRSPTGGPRPEVVVRPPNVPPPKHFVKVKKLFLPVEDDVKVLPSGELSGTTDDHSWWKYVTAALVGLLLLYPLLAWYLSHDACPIIYEKEKDNPAPMVGSYYTSLPVKMKDIKKAEVVMGRPQKEHMKTWSDIEKNWNTAEPNDAHFRAGAAPAEGNARFGIANDEDDDDDDFGADGADGEVGREVKLRRDANLRRNMRLELGRAGKCKEETK